MNLIIPPLPPYWPYPTRKVSSEEHRCVKDTRLPGLTGYWRLETCSNLIFCKQENTSELPFGRGGVGRSGSIVLRPYKRGGLVRRINMGTYFGTNRFRQEFDVHKAVWRSGLPTVEPMGWAYRTNFWGTEGVFLTKFANGTPWPHTWNHSENFMGKLVAILKALCSWGLYAPDLNATNIIVTTNEEPLALDWDKANWSRKTDLMAFYEERLVRSMKRLGAKTDVLNKLQQLIKATD